MIDYDRLALEYARHREVHPEVLKNLLSDRALGRASRVLEVGCGTGNYIVAVEASAGSSCWGIDPSGEMLSKAREQSGRIRFQLGQAERLDFPDDSLDLVFSVDVIHHVGDRLAYFRQARRVLRAGGRIGTITDSEWIIRHRQPLAVYFPETVEIELKRYPRIAELRQLMEQVGFGEITEKNVELLYQVSDIEAYHDRAFSSLHLIPEDAFRRGIEQMERDLRSGPIPCVSRYVLLWGTR
jgi:ubiquinone/menaquinone biosynthesis C-methylase UbiE